MQTMMVLAMATAGFTTYPGFGDMSPTVPRLGQPPAAQTQRSESLRIEAIVDRGPIVEMVIRCGANSAIISYSKVEKLYCSPSLACNPTLSETLELTCRRQGH